MNRLARGDHEAAWEDVQSTFRLAALLTQGAMLIERWSAASFMRRAGTAARTIAADDKLPPGLAARMGAAIDALPPVRMADLADVSQRYQLLHYVMCIAKEGADNDRVPFVIRTIGTPAIPFHGVRWDKVLRQVNRDADDLVAAFALPTPAGRQRALEVFNERIEDSRERLAGPDKRIDLTSVEGTQMAIDYVRCNHGMGGLGAYEALKLHRTQLELTRIAIALAHYRAVHGHYPVTLADLTPGSIKSVPADAYTGRPLHYKRTADGYLLYSEGPNQIDDGGRGIYDDFDDIAVAVGSVATSQAESEP